MKNRLSIKIKSYLAPLSLGLLLSCANPPSNKSSRVESLPYYREATFTPYWYATDSDSLLGFHRIPSFSLINQLGDTLTEQAFANKIYVADFFFTSCPGICPKMTANMKLVQEAFLKEQEVLLLSHSVTPEYDSVAVLREYATNKGAINNKWHLVTGNREEIYALGREAYFIEEDLGLEKDLDEFLHTENFVLIDKNRRIRGIYNGLNKGAVHQLIADIKTLQQQT
jgi:protein SCO1/2